MAHYLSYKYRICPSTEQKERLENIFVQTRYLWNRLLSGELKKEKKKVPSEESPEPDFTGLPPSIRENVLKSFRFTLNHHEAETLHFHRDDKRGSFTCYSEPSSFRLHEPFADIAGIPNILIILHREFPEKRRPINFTVTKTKTGEYYISLLFYVTPDPPVSSPKRFLGLDYSMPYFFIDSLGRRLKYPNFLEESVVRIKKMEISISRMKKNGKNYEKKRMQIARIYEHSAAQRRDYLQRLTTYLWEHYDVICVEDLDLIEMSRTRKSYARNVYNQAYREFIEYLSYKAALKGKTLVKVPRYYPSSKRCSNCGHINNSLSLTERTYRCPRCGMSMDRDVNAAINILEKGRAMFRHVKDFR